MKIKTSCLSYSCLLFFQIKDLNAAKAKVPYKSVADVDERIGYVSFCVGVVLQPDESQPARQADRVGQHEGRG